MTTVQPVWSRPNASSAEFSFEPSSVPAARRAVAADLVAAEVEEPQRVDVLIVLSELLANSVRHARPLENGRVQVLWRVTGGEVEIAVADGGAVTSPRAERPPFAALSGRGLGIVDVLADTWGVVGAGTRHQLVWAVVARTRGEPPVTSTG